MTADSKRFYDFANFRLDTGEKVLFCDGKPVPLTPKVFDTLKILTENAGRLLEKEMLMKLIWQDRFVEEGNLAFNIKVLRKALGDQAKSPKFIETVPRRGYRFIAAVNEISVHDETTDQETLIQKKAVSQISSNRSVVFSSVIIFIVVIFAVFGAWYFLRERNKFDAPILTSPFGSEKLSTNGKVSQAVISPDGKNMIYTNGAGGEKESVWLRQIESTNNTEIIPPTNAIYAGLAISPNGETLYFARRSKDSEQPNSIYRVSIFGGVPAKIADDTEGWMSISPDGKQISFVRCQHQENENCALLIADAADGKNEKKLITRPKPFRIADNDFSPDGKSIAFAVGQSENAANEFGLSEVNLESGREHELTTAKFFNIKNLVWLPNQSGLLLTASKIPNKYFRVWQVSTANGDVQPLTQDSETYDILSLDSAANSLVSTQTKKEFHLKLLDSENALMPRTLNDATRAVFAPDGKIFFSSEMSGNDEIWSINSDGGEQRQLTNDGSDEHSPVVSPDNNFVFFSSNKTGSAQIWQMNSDGSNQKQLTKKEGGFPLFIPRGSEWLYYQHGIHRTLWRVSVKSGEEQIVFDKSRHYFSFSPDGKQIAFSEKQDNERTLKVVSLEGGQIIKTFYPENRKGFLPSIVWMPDGKNLAYVATNSEFQKNALWIQPIGDEAARKIADLGNDEINSISVAPDGKTFAIVQGKWLYDAVLVKGLK